MRISIITVCYNSVATIERTILSVLNQKNADIEYIVINNNSFDGTTEVINKYSKKLIHICESDKGIYNAMNKGLGISSGDVVGFLNADDYFNNDLVISKIQNAFELNNVDYVYGNVVFENNNEIIRSWIVGKEAIDLGSNIQIPHPSFYVKTEILKKLNPPFDEQLSIASDLKLQFMLNKHFKLNGNYINECFVNISLGGVSSRNFSSLIQGWSETIAAYNEVFNKGGFLYLITKILRKFKGLKIIKYFKYYLIK